jgi:hypothetical protein
VHGADDALVASAIAQRLSCRLDAARHRSVRHGAPVPHPLDDLVSGHQAVGVGDEQLEQREHLWLDRDSDAVGAQLERAGVQLVVLEAIDHRLPA